MPERSNADRLRELYDAFWNRGEVWEFRDGLVVRQTLYRTREEARHAADLLLGEG